MDMVRERELNVPIFQKQNLTICLLYTSDAADD